MKFFNKLVTCIKQKKAEEVRQMLFIDHLNKKPQKTNKKTKQDTTNDQYHMTKKALAFVTDFDEAVIEKQIGNIVYPFIIWTIPVLLSYITVLSAPGVFIQLSVLAAFLWSAVSMVKFTRYYNSYLDAWHYLETTYGPTEQELEEILAQCLISAQLYVQNEKENTYGNSEG